MNKSKYHKIRQHLDIRNIFQAYLDVIQELEDIYSVNTTLKNRVHTLERCFPVVQRVIYGVFEGTHLNFSLKLDCRFRIQVWEYVLHVFSEFYLKLLIKAGDFVG